MAAEFSSNRTRVALVDDHAIVEVSLRAALSDLGTVEFLGSTPTVPDLLDEYPDADLVVLDLRLADGSSPAGNVSALRAQGMHVIVYTSGEDPALVKLAARTEVLGIVRKSAPTSTLLETVRAAAAGRPLLSTEWAAAIDADPELADAGLTEEERRVLALFAAGLRTRAVAAELGVREAAVDDHVRRIRQKYADHGQLTAATTTDLFQRAIDDGFLPTPGRE